MTTFTIGMRFENYDDLCDHIKKYEDENFMSIVLRDSVTIECRYVPVIPPPPNNYLLVSPVLVKKFFKIHVLFMLRQKFGAVSLLGGREKIRM